MLPWRTTERHWPHWSKRLKTESHGCSDSKYTRNGMGSATTPLPIPPPPHELPGVGFGGCASRCGYLRTRILQTSSLCPSKCNILSFQIHARNSPSNSQPRGSLNMPRPAIAPPRPVTSCCSGKTSTNKFFDTGKAQLNPSCLAGDGQKMTTKGQIFHSTNQEVAYNFFG